MDGLMRNDMFRVLQEAERSGLQLAGVYRVIWTAGCTVAAALIEREAGEDARLQTQSALWRKGDGAIRRRHVPVRYMKAPAVLAGQIHWFESSMLTELHKADLLQLCDGARGQPCNAERSPLADLNFYFNKRYMSAFLNEERVNFELQHTGNLNRLIDDAARTHIVPHKTIAKLWATLCRFGLDERNLYPRRYGCSA